MILIIMMTIIIIIIIIMIMIITTMMIMMIPEANVVKPTTIFLLTIASRWTGYISEET